MNQLVVAIGEVLFDRFEDQSQLGGAPTNFIGHVAAHGKMTALVSAVGRDELGVEATHNLQQRGIDIRALQTNDLPTGTVDVVLKGGQPSYTINAPAAWDAINYDETIKTLIQRASAICFGTLAQRADASRETIHRALKSCSSNSLRLLDVNLRKPYYDAQLIRDSVALANGLKLNDEELPIVADALGINDQQEQFAALMTRDHGIKFLMITRGASGASMYRDEESCDVAAVPVQNMVSTVGAGDSFTAAAVCGYLDQLPLAEIGRNAANLAAKTCSHAGGLPLV